MPAQTAATLRRRKLLSSLLFVFLLAATAVFALSFLPWFKYLRGDGPKNPYDLVALDKMDASEREKTVDAWTQEWRGLSPDERAEKADQFLDSMVDLMEDKLDLDKHQAVDTKGLVKSAALVANQVGLQNEEMPHRREKMRELGEKVRGQMEMILTPDQRGEFREMLEEREQRIRERTGRTPETKEP
jgi:hypothetical protein